MSLANEFFVLFGKNVTRDARGLNARLHFFGSIPVEDGSPVSSTREDVPSMNVRAARPTVVALVSVNGGVGRSTLATALSSGLQRQGESVVALDLDPQNALRHHFGVSPDAEGLGPASLQNAQWAAIQQPGFAGCKVITFGSTSTRQQESLQRWLTHEPDWLARRLEDLSLGARHTLIIDTPAGNNVYFQQALSVADVVLVVTQADAASLATPDQLDALLAPHLKRERPPRVHFVVNQVDECNAFSLDMVEAFKQRLGSTLYEVHRDVVISESLAFSTDPLDSQSMRLAADDINDLCRLLRVSKKYV